MTRHLAARGLAAAFATLLTTALAFLALTEPAAAASGFTQFVSHNMAPIMFAALVAFLLLGYPVAFALAANGLFFAVVGIELGLFQPNFLQALPPRIYGTMNNDVLLAIPFFTFMGLVLERSGMAEDLLDTIGQVFGTVRGGLAYAVIFVGALLAATTGVVAASVIAMGLISLPIMMRYGYDQRLATGVIAASGTLAQIIPPSLVLIVMADQLGRSVGDMYEGAFIPGIVLAGLYAGYVFLVTVISPSSAPGLPPEAMTIKEDGKNQPLRTAVNMFGVVAVVPALAAAFVAFLVALLVFVVLYVSRQVLHTGDLALPNWALAGIAGIVALYVLVQGVRGGQFDDRPHANLAVLVVLSGIVGWGALAGSNFKGADFVVLSMFVGIVFAFLIAVGDWWRGLAGVLAALAALAVAVIAYRMAPGYLGGVPVWAQAIVRTLVAGGLGAAAFMLIGLVLGSIEAMRTPLLANLTRQVTFVMVPPLFLIFLVLGTIFIGLATPTEGGAMGAVGAMLLAWGKRVIAGEPKRFNLEIVRSATEFTAKLSAFVVFILVGARVFSLTFYGVDGHRWVEELLLSLPGGQTGFLIFVNVLIFLLAFFLDFFELAFIAVPLIGPAADKLGIDLIWLGVMLGVNMQTSFMHPPFGFALFYLRSVAPTEPYVDRVTGKTMEGIRTSQIYWGAVPFVVIQCIMVALVIAFPAMVMHYKAAEVKIDRKQVEDALKNIPGLTPPGGGIPGLAPPGGGVPGGLPGSPPSGGIPGFPAPPSSLPSGLPPPR